MYVIEIIPMRRGMHHGTLSYFSKTPYPRGALLDIPIRKQETQGVVLSCDEVSAAKTALRSATFSLRRLPAQESTYTLPDSLIKTADKLAEYYATQTGAVLFALLPQEIRNGAIKIDNQHTATDEPDEYRYDVLQAPSEGRILNYQSIIRASFARKRSVVLVVPTQEDSAQLYAKLSAGIEKHAIRVYSGMSVTTLRRAYAEIAVHEHPMLIITTPQYALWNRHDVGTFILERSRSFAYRSRMRPYLDFRHAIDTHARTVGAHVISADTLIRTEDEFLLRHDFAAPHDDHPKRIVLPGTLKTIAMNEKPDGQTPFVLFSDILLSTIKKVRAVHGRAFLFSARRGLSPLVACVDCGTIVRCPDSGAPLSLIRTYRDGKEERWFVSSVSGFKRRASDLCTVCGSWRLRERGIGIQQIYDELVKHVPKEDILLLDSDTASTHKKACTIRDEFYSRKDTILLGTMLALPYLNAPIDMSAVVNMDALRAIPSWRQQEEALGVLLALREKTIGYVFAQTRAGDDDLIRYAQKGATADFYTDELSAREEFSYPPYSTFIHLAWKKDATDTLGTQIAEVLAPFNVMVYGAPAAEDKIGYGLIRQRRGLWPEDTLVDALRSLPPSIRITINPDRIT